MRFFCLIFLSLGLSHSASASLYLEPYLGYEIGSYRMQSPGFSNGNVRGVDLGARVGTKLLSLVFVTLDGRYGKLKDAPGVAGTIYDGDVTAKSLGVTAGVDFPILLRAWMGYNFYDQMEYSVASTAQYSGYTVKGSAIKFGIGFTPLILLSLNVEYIIYNQSKILWSGGSLGGREENLASTNVGDLSRDYSSVLFSVSVPLSL